MLPNGMIVKLYMDIDQLKRKRFGMKIKFLIALLFIGVILYIRQTIFSD